MNQAPAVHPDAICLSCGYSLTGLPSDGACPECQTPIERSIRGGGMIAASPEYVASLRTGATLAFLSVLLDIVWFCGMPVLISLSSEGVLPITVEASLRLVTLIDLCGMALGTWGGGS